MRDRNAALDQAIREIDSILGDALVRLLLLKPANLPVDLPETEIPHLVPPPTQWNSECSSRLAPLTWTAPLPRTLPRW